MPVNSRIGTKLFPSRKSLGASLLRRLEKASRAAGYVLLWMRFEGYRSMFEYDVLKASGIRRPGAGAGGCAGAVMAKLSWGQP